MTYIVEKEVAWVIHCKYFKSRPAAERYAKKIRGIVKIFSEKERPDFGGDYMANEDWKGY